MSVPDGIHWRAARVARASLCGFHGWQFDLNGDNTYILDPQDWQDKLTPEMTCLSPVKVGVWGGYIYINMVLDCMPLKEWMGRAAVLDHFELSEMRYKWRQWAVYPCNWKTAIEAFLEPYHVAGTHTQLLAYGDYYALSKQYGLHSVSSYDTRDAKFQMSESAGTTRAGKGDDARVSTYELIKENYETVNFTASTETLVKAASRLVDELPETATPTEIIAHWLKSAKADDAARGVIWPEVPPEIKQESGLAWGLWPNQNILHGETFALCYRVRPWGDDPNKCLFESYALERFPPGEEPKSEWVHAEPTGENWGSVLAQDFSNMEFVQKGMKSSGFRGCLPNPHQEQKVINLHRNLADWMEGRGAPKLLDFSSARLRITRAMRWRGGAGWITLARTADNSRRGCEKVSGSRRDHRARAAAFGEEIGMARLTRTSVYLSSALGALALSASPALAQAGEDKDGGGLEDIVVTAQRQAQSVLEVPLSITAMSGEQLTNSGIRQMSDLQLTTPGFAPSNSSGYNQMFIRGVGNSIFVGADPSVATFIDDVPRVFGTLVNNFVDVERVEVIKGAPGALYGRNATGGAVNIITRQPSTDGVAAKARLTYGTKDTVQASAFINLPLGEKAALTMGGELRKHDGYIKNITPNAAPYTAAMFPGGSVVGDAAATAAFYNRGTVARDAYNTEDFWAVSSKLMLQPTDTLKVTIAGDYSKKDDDNGNGAYNLTPEYATAVLSNFLNNFGGAHTTVPGLASLIVPVTKKFTTAQRTIGVVRLDDYGVSATAALELPGVDLTSITAYRKNKSEFLTELGFTPFAMVQAHVPLTKKTFYQELRAVSNSDGPLDYIVGASYLRTQLDGGLFSNLIPPLINAVPAELGGYVTKNWSVYAQLGYDLTEQLNLTVSGRYIHEKNNAHSINPLTQTDDPFTMVEEVPALGDAQVRAGRWRQRLCPLGARVQGGRHRAGDPGDDLPIPTPRAASSRARRINTTRLACAHRSPMAASMLPRRCSTTITRTSRSPPTPRRRPSPAPT